jgi:hypothetical protein
MASSREKRAVSPTLTESGSVTITAAANKDDSLLLKKGMLKMAVFTAFHGDRSKFKAYVLQIRLY